VTRACGNDSLRAGRRFIRPFKPPLVVQGLPQLTCGSVEVARFAGFESFDQQRASEGPTRQSREFGRQIPIDQPDRVLYGPQAAAKTRAAYQHLARQAHDFRLLVRGSPG
jgi:hypothetical protein